MAKTPTQKPVPESVPPQQQGQDAPADQMASTAKPAPQQGTPVFRDWASI